MAPFLLTHAHEQQALPEGSNKMMSLLKFVTQLLDRYHRPECSGSWVEDYWFSRLMPSKIYCCRHLACSRVLHTKCVCVSCYHKPVLWGNDIHIGKLSFVCWTLVFHGVSVLVVGPVRGHISSATWLGFLIQAPGAFGYFLLLFQAPRVLQGSYKLINWLLPETQ